MKRIHFCIICLFVTVCSWAQPHSKTNSRISISELELLTGEDIGTNFFVISLEGSQLYTAVTMDIVIPDGIEFVYNNNGEVKISYSDEKKSGLFPITNLNEMEECGAAAEHNSHTLSANLINAKTLRVVLMSLQSTDFAHTSGPMFRVYVKASACAKAGYADVKISNCFFNTEDGVQWDTEDIVISNKLKVFNETCLAKIAKEESEAIYTLQGVQVTKMLPGHIYVKGGKIILNLK